MRVGVIRGDLPGPINEPGRLFLADLEPTSQFNPPTEPFGQTRYISRPDPVALTDYLAGVFPRDISAMDGGISSLSTPPTLVSIPVGQPFYGGVPAGVQSSAPLAFPGVGVTFAGGADNVLVVSNTSPAGAGTSVNIPAGTYTTMAALLTAINSVLVPTGIAKAVSDSTGTKVVIQSTIPGVGSIITLTAGTNTTPINLAAGATFTVPAATAIIAALNPTVTPPATGSINVSAANILANVGASPAASQVADFIAPQFKETEVAVQSFQLGNLSEYLDLAWNPDPRRLPAITSGPAIQVVQDDGNTPFVAPLPMITAAASGAPAAGDITITGVGLGSTEFLDQTVVTVTAAAGTGGQTPPRVRLTQQQITSAVTDGVALVGTFSVASGSSAVTASADQTGALVPGSLIVFSTQPGVVYEVSTIVTTAIVLTGNYTGPSNGYAAASSPKTRGVVSATSIVIPAVLLNALNGSGPAPGGLTALGVAGSTVEVKYETQANSNYGSTAATSTFANGLLTVTGLTNQQASQVGSYLTLSGSVNPGNNGRFQIVSWVSATSVVVANVNGVGSDAGPLVWSEPAPVAFVVT